MKNKILIFLTIAVFGVICFYLGKISNTKNNNINEVVSPGIKACTMEAKICPDGSSVGRSGPNCEFAPCP